MQRGTPQPGDQVQREGQCPQGKGHADQPKVRQGTVMGKADYTEQIQGEQRE